jgi:hypothetical protein
MTTVISQIATDSIVLSDKTRVIKLSGKLAGSYKPGTLVYQSATDTWTATTGTASQNHYVVGAIEFKKRTSSTFGEVDIDTAYTDGTAINVEIIVGPRDGSLKLACLCQDLSATKYFGNPVQATSGGLWAKHNKSGSSANQGYITEDGYTNGDTAVKIYLGANGGISIA